MLELRYGLNGERPRTLDEVGRTFNVTRERIRQIEHHSLIKLQKLPETDSRTTTWSRLGFGLRRSRPQLRRPST